MAEKHPKLYTEELVVKVTTLAGAADMKTAGVDVGTVVFISDATPPNLAVFDGTNWLAADDGLTAA